MFGVHFSPVSSTVPAPDPTKTLFFSALMPATASAIDEFGRSKIASTLSFSYQRRAMPIPMSVLFWWSAATTSTGLPAAFPPKSSTAILAATTEPMPW
ncbi:hypothetical protein ABH991_003272 [Bradyrhizobium ottawaense]